MEGKLYLVPTPIGNLKDITLRALEVLEGADLILAEDTRESVKLLSHFNIKKPLMSYHKFNEKSKCDEIIRRLKEGEMIALVSDAGTPGISDPGFIIAKRCIEENMPFEVLPGATAITVSLLFSGFDNSEFTFIGFLPRENKDRKKVINRIKDRTETFIFYEAPHRIIETLDFLRESLGDRNIAACRELTKVHEEIIRGSISKVLERFAQKPPKGEFVIVMEGKSLEEIEEESRKEWEGLSVEDHIKKYMNEGLNKREAIKKVANDRNEPKSEIYKHSYDI